LTGPRSRRFFGNCVMAAEATTVVFILGRTDSLDRRDRERYDAESRKDQAASSSSNTTK